jgi:hypothetical protein
MASTAREAMIEGTAMTRQPVNASTGGQPAAELCVTILRALTSIAEPQTRLFWV